MDDASHRGIDGSGKLSLQWLQEITNGFSEELKLGNGPFGTVYKGVLADGQVIAVKVLRYMPEVDGEQFENVCEQLRCLTHENLVQLLGFCNTTEEIPDSRRTIRFVNINRVICLEFVPNRSLAYFLSEQYLGVNWQVCFKIIKGICEGLQYLHESSIMHFDLKPENVLLDEKMVPKITDFGLSQLLGKENTAVRVSSQGTSGFVPPEFLTQRHMSDQYDVFSLGAIIKKIVTGAMEYLSMDDIEDDEEKIELVHNIWRKKLQQRRMYPSLEADCRQVRACITIALNCMNPDKHKRPHMRDIIRELHEVEPRENDPGAQIGEDICDDKVRCMTYVELACITDHFSEKLGHTGNGAVYKGKIANGELVAVKKLDKSSGELHQQFDRMLNLIMRLEHKNIVQLKGYCYKTSKEMVHDDKNPELCAWQDVAESFLCYEFLPNGSMDNIVSEKSCELDWHSRHAIIRGICEGLHYLHEGCQDAPIVHNDLKPSNIFLDNDMVPKLGDCGLPWIFPKEEPNVATNIAVRPRGYIAPEFMDTGKVTIKSNIYSLGVLILEIATGDKCPNDESSGRSYIENVLKARMQDSYISPKYPSLEAGFIKQVEYWISIGLKCVEIRPKRRPTIGQLMHFLETESANPEYYDYGEFSISSENNITSWPSSEMGDHANELGALESMLCDASTEPTKLSYVLLKSVTRNFSRIIGRGGFGVVYLV